MFDFEPIRNDVGLELKNTAESIFNKTVFLIAFLAVLEFIVSIIIAAMIEEVSVVIYTVIAIAVEALIIIGIARILAMSLYAKGEMVHLLRELTEQTPTVSSSTVAANAGAEAVEQVQHVNYSAPAAPCVVDENFWFCSKCGTKNKAAYGQCKHCGTYRSAQ